ncbi:DNA primase small subunit-like isoform X1 [Salvia splendens]|uniref:DNA primase small subunit-like isoform X1 n=1 Tax=Salvia splendens TaxID=180675 RepID=UPI001C264852|nr:DNA primase small subunit-like isoform X1 [Salvia splendens]
MVREEAENTREDMVIDGVENGHKPNYEIPDGFNSNYLKTYYVNFFPYAEMHKWMSYGNDGKHPGCDASYFGRREFSFTLENDIYLRFQSFKDVDDLEKAIKHQCPFKIDIGPVYSVDPKKRSAYGQSDGNVFRPVERELVFDIDISDYDDVRFCCKGADVCSACWPLMTVAIKIIDTALREDFGFNHILWVYSGRRGVHCWVCDGKARRLDDGQRAAIVNYLHVHKGNEHSIKKVTLVGQMFHPFIGRSAEVVKEFFEEKFVLSQNLFSDEDRYEKILEMIPDESITSELRGKWQDKKRTRDDINVVRWGQLKYLLQSGKQKMLGVRRCVEEIMFTFTYPRLDLEVSKHMNHLLKAPFCIHPKTGRVCVPIDPKHCEDFDPSSVPTLSRLLEELNMRPLGSGGEINLENTSLGESYRYFKSSFLHPLLKSCKEDIENAYAAKVQQSSNSLSW